MAFVHSGTTPVGDASLRSRVHAKAAPPKPFARKAGRPPMSRELRSGRPGHAHKHLTHRRLRLSRRNGEAVERNLRPRMCRSCNASRIRTVRIWRDTTHESFASGENRSQIVVGGLESHRPCQSDSCTSSRSVNNPAHYYAGLTSNVSTRLSVHNSGGSRYTAQLRPWRLIVALGFRERHFV
jgi:hypothetical protein